MITINSDADRVPKKWGCEVIVHNSELYCGKLLYFGKGSKFSMHFHAKKTETWYVQSGRFRLKYIDTLTGDIMESVISVGMVIHIPTLQPHQLIALSDGCIFEVSTQHFDGDSYRIDKGDNQL